MPIIQRTVAISTYTMIALVVFLDLYHVRYAKYIKDFLDFDCKVFGKATSDDFSYSPPLTLYVSCGTTSGAHKYEKNAFFVNWKFGPNENNQCLRIFKRSDFSKLAKGENYIVKLNKIVLLEASWIIDREMVSGVEMRVKSATAQSSGHVRVLFKVGAQDSLVVTTIAILSESHFGELATPKGNLLPYPSLPSEKSTFFATYGDAQLLGLPKPRAPQKFTQFCERNPPPLKLSLLSVDCFKCGASTSDVDPDAFLLTFDAVNFLPTPLEIEQVSVWWLPRDAGVNGKWQSAKLIETTLNATSDKPKVISGNRWGTLKLFVEINTTGIARLAPLLFDVELTVDGGTKISLTIEHTADQLFAIPGPETKSSRWMLLENPVTHAEAVLEVTKPGSSESAFIFRASSHSKLAATVSDLRHAVVRALKSPSLNGVVPMGNSSVASRDFSFTVSALVDVLCRRVYAFRVDAMCGPAEGPSVRAVRFFTVPDYGDADVLNPVYAPKTSEATSPMSITDSDFTVQTGILWREQSLIDFVPRVTTLPESYVQEQTSIRDIESKMTSVIEKQMAELFAKNASAFKTSLEKSNKLDVVLAKLTDIDTRISKVEAAQASRNAEVQRFVDTLAGKVDGLGLRIDENNRNILDSIHNSARSSAMGFTESSFDDESLTALDALARRLEAVGNTAGGMATSIGEAKSLASLAQRLEAIASSPMGGDKASLASKDSGTEKLDAIVSALNQRMEKMEHLATINESVSSGIRQIIEKQAELNQDWRSASALSMTAEHGWSSTSRMSDNSEILAKLAELETRVNAMPQIYKTVVESSVQRQTVALTALMDKRNSGASDNTRSFSSSPTPAKKSVYRLSVPTVPNMGISSGLSKLSGALRNRMSSGSGSAHSRDSEANEE
ncbi:hypothetical protein HDU82_007898 [Entophlyctis luteolus]|nr:hypothetical protein HDU82_007898 [Entophlyctis luteolus]